MGNRHHDKKLRAEVRARMARTGETYQRALDRVLRGRRASANEPRVDLQRIDWFGDEAALATIQNMGVTMCFIVSMPHRRLPVALPATWTVN
jgi:hypothetical protein